MRTIFPSLLLLSLSVASMPRSALAENAPSGGDIAKDLVVTSDSKAYCQRLDEDLASLISQPHNVPVNTMEDARILQTQGEALCDHGHIRAGIERLRRALVMLKKYGEPKK